MPGLLIWLVGIGSILIQENKGSKTTLEIIEGFRMPSGFLSSQFITNERKSTIEYNEPYFFISNHILETVEQILPVLTLMSRQQKPLIVVADDVQRASVGSFSSKLS